MVGVGAGGGRLVRRPFENFALRCTRSTVATSSTGKRGSYGACVHTFSPQGRLPVNFFFEMKDREAQDSIVA